MCDLICDVIGCSVWSCDMGKINVYDKIITENKKRRKYRNQRNMYINLHHVTDGLGMAFTAC